MEVEGKSPPRELEEAGANEDQVLVPIRVQEMVV